LTKCPCCGPSFKPGDTTRLGEHFYAQALASDAVHVMWLNRNITKTKTDAKSLSTLFAEFFKVGEGGLQDWVKRRFVEKFYGSRPHPFVLALQHPSRGTLLGYAVEHQHFLRQWVRSCSFIMARTDATDVILYELDNINTEFGGLGPKQPSHYELLLRMGESLGLDRTKILATPALTDTVEAIQVWDNICQQDHWVEAMVAMHGLKLIANRNLRKEEGCTISIRRSWKRERSRTRLGLSCEKATRPMLDTPKKRWTLRQRMQTDLVLSRMSRPHS